MRDFISRTICSVVAQYDNDDGDGNMINCDIDDMIMVMLKKIMKAFKRITKMMNTSLRLYAKNLTRCGHNSNKHEHAINTQGMLSRT